MKITAPVQHYLRSAWYYQQKADFLNEKILVLRSKAQKITTSFQDVPTFGGFEDHRQQVIAEMVDLEREYGKSMMMCRNKAKEIEFVIGLLENHQEKLVLEMRYLHHDNWIDIAINLNYSVQMIYKIHGRALINLLKINKQAEQTSGKSFF